MTEPSISHPGHKKKVKSFKDQADTIFGLLYVLSVIVISIPDWGGSPFAAGQNPAAISAGIDQFNEVNRTLTKDREIAYVDVTGISRQAASKPDMFAEDGLHPSRKQYELWVDTIYPAVTRAKK